MDSKVIYGFYLLIKRFTVSIFLCLGRVGEIVWFGFGAGKDDITSGRGLETGLWSRKLF